MVSRENRETKFYLDENNYRQLIKSNFFIAFADGSSSIVTACGAIRRHMLIAGSRGESRLFSDILIFSPSIIERIWKMGFFLAAEKSSLARI